MPTVARPAGSSALGTQKSSHGLKSKAVPAGAPPPTPAAAQDGLVVVANAERLTIGISGGGGGDFGHEGNDDAWDVAKEKVLDSDSGRSCDANRLLVSDICAETISLGFCPVPHPFRYL